MTKYMIYVISVALFFGACNWGDQKGNTPNTDQVEEQGLSTGNEITQVVTKFNNAMVNKDSLQLDGMTSANLTYGHSSGLVQNKDEFIEDVLHGPFNFSMINTPEQHIRLIENTAIVRHVFEARATNAGQPVDIRIGNIQVYHRNTMGKWELLARQAFKL